MGSKLGVMTLVLGFASILVLFSLPAAWLVLVIGGWLLALVVPRKKKVYHFELPQPTPKVVEISKVEQGLRLARELDNRGRSLEYIKLRLGEMKFSKSDIEMILDVTYNGGY